MGLVGSATPFGFFFGAILSGWLGDRFGRKKVMMWALAVYAVMTLGAAAAPNFGFFLVFRVLAGLGTGAESVIIAPFISEFIPPKRRGLFIGSLAGFFSFGFVGAAVIGRFIVPLGDNGWRWAQVMTALPILLLLWWRRSLPESPRFLLSHGRVDEAETVVAGLEERVRKATGRELPPVAAEQFTISEHRAKVTVWHALRAMWSGPMRRKTAVIWVIWFVITFCYYGFFSWIPTLLIGRGISVTTSFEYSIIIYLAQIPGYFSAAYLNDKIERKYTIAIYLTGAALSAYLAEPVERRDVDRDRRGRAVRSSSTAPTPASTPTRRSCSRPGCAPWAAALPVRSAGSAASWHPPSSGSSPPRSASAECSP